MDEFVKGAIHSIKFVSRGRMFYPYSKSAPGTGFSRGFLRLRSSIIPLGTNVSSSEFNDSSFSYRTADFQS